MQASLILSRDNEPRSSPDSSSAGMYNWRILTSSAVGLPQTPAVETKTQ